MKEALLANIQLRTYKMNAIHSIESSARNRLLTLWKWDLFLVRNTARYVERSAKTHQKRLSKKRFYNWQPFVSHGLIMTFTGALRSEPQRKGNTGGNAPTSGLLLYGPCGLCPLRSLLWILHCSRNPTSTPRR